MMELITEIWTFLTESVGPYWPYIWPFLTVATVSAIVGQVFQRRVWTEERAKTSAFIAFGRDTLVLHPMGVCGSLGFVWRDPCGAHWSLPASVSYFLMAGVVSFWGFWLLDKWLEKRGYDLDEGFEPRHLMPLDTPTDPDVKPGDTNDAA